MNKIFKYFLFSIIVLPQLITYVNAADVYQSPEDFLAEVFSGEVPASDKVWIRNNMQTPIRGIMGHDLGVLRLRFWQKNNKTAWILEEIGKERPITTGIVVNNNKIETIKILIFRESRGWEVRYPFFTDQFKDASMLEDYQLDRSIDGISGATLSVSAVTRLARLALYLTHYINNNN